MPLVPLDLSPGIYKNGTPYRSRGRWADSNLVRWWDNSIQAIGGWTRRRTTAGANIDALFADASLEAPRNIISWRSNDGEMLTVVGTNLGLYYISRSGVITDITPVGFTGGSKNEADIVGYGSGPYGVQPYGAPRVLSANLRSPVFSWSFALWGEDLLCQPRGDGPLYRWVPVSVAAVEETTVPLAFQAILVTDERILIGARGRELIWSDSEDFTDFTVDATTQAGSQPLAARNDFVAAVTLFDQHLFISETDVFRARYIGPPFIFQITRVASSTDILSANGVAVTDNFVIWPGNKHFWLYDGAKVNPVMCDLQDFFYNDIEPTALSKTYAVTNRQYQEVWWFYQSRESTTGEPDSYIAFSYVSPHWHRGRLNRAIGEDQGVLRNPVYVSPAGLLFDHELSGVSLTSENDPFCETAPMEIGAGDNGAAIDYLYPDFELSSDMTVTIKARNMPSAPERVYGPYPLVNPTMVRAQGRQVAFRFEGTGARWRIGTMRANLKQTGKR